MSLSFLLLIFIYHTKANEYSLHSAVYDDGRVCCGPDVLIDGDTSTYWNSAPSSPPTSRWAIFEFEQNVILDEFALWNMGDTTHDMKDFQLHFSADPSGPWTVLNQWSAASGPGWQYFNIDTAVQTSYYKYWRVWILNAYSGWQPQPREFVFTYLNQQIQDVYVRTATHQDAGSPHTVTLTLWFDHTIYQCNIIPSSTNSLYGCDSLTYTIMDTCTSGASQYKIMLDVPDYNAPIFSSIYVTDFDGTVYGINSWCIPDSVVSATRYQSMPSWLGSPDNCTAQYGSNTAQYTNLCIDTEANDCGPHQQILYFDITKPNQDREASPWEDATALIIPQFSCPQSSPIDCLTSAAPSNVIGWYNMESLDLTNNAWNDISMNENHGTIDDSTGIGIFDGIDTSDDLYLNGHSVLYGTTNTQITFGSSIKMPTTHTVFSLCKHPNPIGTKNRIIQATDYNGVFGFSNQGSGIAFEEGAYITERTDKFGREWVLSSQTKSLYRGNFIDFTVGASVPPRSTYLTINNGYYQSQESDFAIVEVFVVNQELSLSDIQCVEQYFGSKYLILPTSEPSQPTTNPTISPTLFPTNYPTQNPSANPSKYPTKYPTLNPTLTPITNTPTKYPTQNPSANPTKYPTKYPSKYPSLNPTLNPTLTPITSTPTLIPTVSPTNIPTKNPTEYPTKLPSKSPTKNPLSEGEGGINNDVSSTNPNMNDSLEFNDSNNDGNMSLIMIIAGGAVVICVCAVVIIWKIKNKKNELKSVETNTKTTSGQQTAFTNTAEFKTVGSVSPLMTPTGTHTEMMNVSANVIPMVTTDYGRKETEGMDTFNTKYSDAYGEGNEIDTIANMNDTTGDDAMVSVLNSQHETKGGIVTNGKVNVDDIVNDLNKEHQTKGDNRMHWNDDVNDIVSDINKTKGIQDDEYEYYYEDEHDQMEQMNATQGGDNILLDDNEFEVIDDNVNMLGNTAGN